MNSRFLEKQWLQQDVYFFIQKRFVLNIKIYVSVQANIMLLVYLLNKYYFDFFDIFLSVFSLFTFLTRGELQEQCLHVHFPPPSRSRQRVETLHVKSLITQ